MESWKSIIKNDKRYHNFILPEKPIRFCELFANRDISVVQLHSTQVYCDGIVGFCGAFSWIDNVLNPLDGDSYSEDTPVYGYEWFTDKDGNRCLDILVGEEW